MYKYYKYLYIFFYTCARGRACMYVCASIVQGNKIGAILKRDFTHKLKLNSNKHRFAEP